MEEKDLDQKSFEFANLTNNVYLVSKGGKLCSSIEIKELDFDKVKQQCRVFGLKYKHFYRNYAEGFIEVYLYKYDFVSNIIDLLENDRCDNEINMDVKQWVRGVIFGYGKLEIEEFISGKKYERPARNIYHRNKEEQDFLRKYKNVHSESFLISRDVRWVSLIYFSNKEDLKSFRELDPCFYCSVKYYIGKDMGDNAVYLYKYNSILSVIKYAETFDKFDKIKDIINGLIFGYAPNMIDEYIKLTQSIVDRSAPIVIYSTPSKKVKFLEEDDNG